MRSILAPLAAGSLVLGACADSAPLAPDALDPLARQTTQPATGPWANVVTGETGPGSQYAVYVPEDWNGDVVYFVHGIIAPLEPIALPQAPTDWDGFTLVRDQLGALGYTVAYSSFSENGLAIKDGAQRTHQLRGLVSSIVPERPDRSFLVGYSLGSAVALQLAERFPMQYDGALLACGMVGGTPLELQYIGDVRALFDHYYPDVLPGDVVTVPDGYRPTLAELTTTVVAAVRGDPVKLLAIASTAQTPLAYAPIGSVTDPSSPAFQSLVGSLVAALYYQIVGTPDVVARTHGHSPFDNTGTTYALGTPVVPALAPVLGALVAGSDAGVARYTTTPDARNYLERYYVPSGDLEIPVLTVHNRWDYLVPFAHEAELGRIVQAAGATDMLVQRAVADYGHCSNASLRATVLQSFQDLVAWSTTGVKPAA